MSRETFEALEAALAAHIADETPGLYVSDFVAVVASSSPEASDETNYTYLSSFGPLHTKLGLLGMATRWYASAHGRHNEERE